MAEKASSAPDSKPFLSFLYLPEETINYSFILASYGVCSLVCFALYLLEKVVLVEAIKGWWIVFAPFVLMTPWALWMRMRAESLEKLKKKSD